MVKIVNQLGDVKVGRQGEVVYQRKYGEQIRRQASPKRAIPSEAQIAHRQLYRDALAWRSQLSLPNRRYLDGYSIANGIVDSYHIPLTWSRLALKLYLQKVKFAIITKPTLIVEEGSGKQEYYDNLPDFDKWRVVYDKYYWGQQFTPQHDLELTEVEIFVYRTGNSGDVTAGIYATNGAGLPTGSPLVEVVKAQAEVPASPIWWALGLTLPKLDKDSIYALCVDAEDGDSSNRLNWRQDTINPTYPRGYCVTSNTHGSTWFANPTMDFAFRIYGNWSEKSGELGLIHVRHPALLKVVHKREGVVINGYDTLSSLDEEYLTGQVGLDVMPEDSIKATSLPGIEFDYRVG